MRTIRAWSLGLAFAGLTGCATPAVVMVSSNYKPQEIKRAAFVGFDDYPGQQGSGALVADAFEKYLLKGPYPLVARSEADQALTQQHLTLGTAANTKHLATLGAALNVDAVILGSVAEYTNTSEQTVMVNEPQEESDPIIGEVVTRQRQRGQVVTTRQPVVTGYVTSYTNQIVPETQTLPARVGINVRMVRIKGGEVLWSGSGMGDGMTLSAAAEDAAQRVMNTLEKKLREPPR